MKRTGIIVLLGAAIVYGFSLSHDVGFWDYGELQTVPYILGLAHTTGFPAEILSGWIFAHLVPLGSVAFRITLLCALCAAGSALCCYAIAVELGADAFVASAAALCYALMPLVWSHASTADVMNEAVFLSAATLRFALIARRNGRMRGVAVTAGIGGLAMGTHAAVIFYLPAAIAAVLGKRWRWRAIILGIAAFVAVTGAVYSYLPIRSCQVERQRLDPTRQIGLSPGMPIWDWGGPCRLSDFVGVVTGRQAKASRAFHSYLDLPRYPQFFVSALVRLGTLWGGVALVAAALANFAAQKRATRTLTWPLFLPFVLVTPFADTFGAESDAARYYILPALCLWAQIAIGFSALCDSLAPSTWRKRAQAVGVTALAAVCIAFLVRGNGLFEQRHDRLGGTYIADVIASTRDTGVVIAPWVDATPLAYAAYASHTFGRRLIVFGDARGFSRMTPRWIKTRPVYEIGERPSVSGAVFVARLHLAASFDRDTKIFRLR